jgi:hypothetical protein
MLGQLTRQSMAMARTSPDPVTRLAGEFPLGPTLLALARCQLAPWRLQYPVMDTVVHHLQSVSLCHAEESPSTDVMHRTDPGVTPTTASSDPQYHKRNL